MKLKYDYCKIAPDKDRYVVEYGHNTYKGYILSSPIKVSDRTFSTEKKAVRFAKKIVPVECIKKEESQKVEDVRLLRPEHNYSIVVS